MTAKQAGVFIAATAVAFVLLGRAAPADAADARTGGAALLAAATKSAEPTRRPLASPAFARPTPPLTAAAATPIRPPAPPAPNSVRSRPPREVAQAPLPAPTTGAPRTSPPPPATAAPSAQPFGIARPAEPGGAISALRVEGSQRVDPGTVLSYMKLRPGDRYDRERLDESLKALYATGYFKDVRFRREGDALVVVVVENPVINRIAFEGNRRLENDALADEISLKPRLVYTISRAQADAQRIVELYRRSGRFNVKVEPKLIELEQNRVDLIFEIDEGGLTEIRRIVFIGNKRFSDGQLRSVINTSESRWYTFFGGNDIYDPDRLAFDQELLRKYYLSEGYVDFQVISAVAELEPNKEGFIITFTVEEGEQYTVGSIGVESRLTDLPGAALRPLVTFSEGDVYDIEEVDETVEDIVDEVARYGYAFVDVRPQVNRRRDEKAVDIVFEIGEGPRVYVERIDIVGNVRTLDRVIRREMQIAEGDAFNRAKVRESERRIRRLGFFETVKIENVPTEAADRTRLVVEVVEQSTGELSVGAGVSSDSGLLANASIRERNLLGKGQDLALSFGLSFDDTELDLSFTEPYFLNRPLSAGFDVFAAERDREDESNYSQQSVGAGLRMGYELARHWRQSWGYQLRQDDIEADAGASRFILAQEGKAITSRLSHTLAYDNTDNFFSPSEGYRLTIDNAIAGLGGDVAYFSTQAKASVFFPLAEETVLSLSGRAGGITGIDDDVRLNDRYFLGGTSFRGFAPAGVGARDAATDDALGGNFFYLGTAEVAFPLGLPEEVGLTGRAFAEAGALFEVDDVGPGIQDSKNPRVSVGLGLTWNSPFGPLRIDFGYALVKEDFDDDEIISFTFGTRF